MSTVISNATSTTGIDWNAEANPRVPTKQLGQDDFLRLLLTKLTSQDPMNPEKDSDFIAQMAQFSSLEQSKAMQADMAAMRSEQQLLQASALIGQTVQVAVNDEVTNSGVVSSVKIIEGTPKLVIGGINYDLSQVLTITPTPVQPAATAS